MDLCGIIYVYTKSNETLPIYTSTLKQLQHEPRILGAHDGHCTFYAWIFKAFSHKVVIANIMP